MKNTSLTRRPAWRASVGMTLLALAGVASATPVQVWVQPSGDTFANAYAITGESRTYFGRTEGGSGSYEYKWDFSDGTTTGFTSAGNPNYIDYAGKSFASFGTQWALLTVRDATDHANTASAQINLQVIAAGSDNLNRKKNSAIDRGLRWQYQVKNDAGSYAYWTGSNAIASTGLALIAFENQGHNLESPDSDIYKKSVRQGVQYLLNNAQVVNLSSQRCIGNPETAASGDTLVDGVGVMFENSGYSDPIAVLALANSAGKSFAQSYVASTSNGVNGWSLYNIGIQSKDWLAWAQGDGNSGGGGGVSCQGGSPAYGWFQVFPNSSGVSDVQGYAYNNGYAMPGGTLGGKFKVDWGDGSTLTYTDIDENGWASYYNEPSLSYYTSGPSHVYAGSGSHTISFSWIGADNTTTQNFCSVNITTTAGAGSGFTCGASDGVNGGWRYGANYSDSDNSAAQWPVLALTELSNRWNVEANPYVKNMVDLWLDYSACTGGAAGNGAGNGFGYASPNSWCNYQKSAAGLIMLHYAGTRTATDSIVVNDFKYLGNNWDTYNGDYNFNNHYAMYAMYKAMKIWNRTTIADASSTNRDWETEYDTNLVNRQNGDGSWSDNGGWFDTYGASATALAILAPSIASLPPVANAGGPYAAIAANTGLMLDGSLSSHQDANKHIVKYEWDYDSSDGLWWSTKASPAAGEGGIGIRPTVSYPDAGSDRSYTVTLRVTDDSTPSPMQAVASTGISVRSGEVPPVARTNGPWTALPYSTITFDGSASFDPNACTTAGNPVCTGDSIVSYEWDLNGDGTYNNGNGSDGACVSGTNCRQTQKSYTSPVSLPVRLRVCDSHGQCSTSNDTVNVVSIALVYGQNYQTCYRKTIDRFTDEIGMQVTFKNQGTAAADNVVMSLTGLPTNMTAVSNSSSLGTLAAGASRVTACDATAKTADLKMRVNKKITPTGSWVWRAVFDFQGSHYTVDNLPPIGP